VTEVALRGGKAPSKTSDPQDKWAQPEHAFLDTYEPKHVKNGSPQLGSPKGRIAFQFNPKEVSITKSATWKRDSTKNKTAAPPEYIGPEPCKLTLEMFFDASMNGGVDVVTSVDALFACCVPYKKFNKNEHPMPVLVVFNWGNVSSFAAYVSQVQAKYTRFAADGRPIRAVCTVNLEEIDVSDPPKQNPTSGTRSPDDVHVLVAGERLAHVAHGQYGDPTLWRPLAAYNGIDDPLRVPDGTRLLLPRLDVLLAQTD
jgi:hypothetical protein